MLDSLYEFFRGASGFSLLISGLSLLLAKHRINEERYFGLALFGAGMLFCLSALDPLLKTQIDIGNFILLSGMFMASLAFHKLVLYLFGGEKNEGFSKIFIYFAIIWSLVLSLLPFVDYIFGLRPVAISIEDGNLMPPFHYIVYLGMYVLPVLAPLWALFICRWSFGDMLSALPKFGRFLPGLTFLLFALCLIAASMFLESQNLYRLGHTVLQLFLLGWYIYLVTRPNFFPQVRTIIENSHERNLNLDNDEIALIESRIKRMLQTDTLIQNPELDLALLAEKIGLPAYRLSVFFNTQFNSSFPAWLNTQRINSVCKLIQLHPEKAIIDLALSVGYRSKSSFNKQFKLLKGTSPSAWKKSNLQ